MQAHLVFAIKCFLFRTACVGFGTGGILTSIELLASAILEGRFRDIFLTIERRNREDEEE